MDGIDVLDVLDALDGADVADAAAFDRNRLHILILSNDGTRLDALFILFVLLYCCSPDSVFLHRAYSKYKSAMGSSSSPLNAFILSWFVDCCL